MALLEGLDRVEPGRHLELLPYVSGRAEYVEPRPGGDPWNDGVARLRGRRARLPVRARDQDDARRRHQPGLRPGRGRPRRREPHRVRDVLRGEAAVLHRGQPGVLRFGRSGAADYTTLLLPGAHSSSTRAASGALPQLGRAGSSSMPRGDHDPRRGEARRPDEERLEPRRSSRRSPGASTRASRPGQTATASRPSPSPTTSSVARSASLGTRGAIGFIGTAVVRDRHRRPRGAAAGPRARRRRRRPRVPRPPPRLGALGRPRRQLPSPAARARSSDCSVRPSATTSGRTRRT